MCKGVHGAQVPTPHMHGLRNTSHGCGGQDGSGRDQEAHRVSREKVMGGGSVRGWGLPGAVIAQRHPESSVPERAQSDSQRWIRDLDRVPVKDACESVKFASGSLCWHLTAHLQASYLAKQGIRMYIWCRFKPLDMSTRMQASRHLRT
ncbi:hypothetical protein PHLGIDRAFT_307858 [Phlebiopsis gigantea 11061_1 CR5-6]|uniref:Uncharacterized protein n=1 Tax=Phlebiopsis gigantea (strain 11061_1 CR5-6) TaxID=745531 RepID=A0A0C3PR73_PHLG1|nr:hypothetical protein PHLGIDRAFT_307858 [Phlebiopsis gigantea 11061_1 CR5-6]